MGQHPTLAKQAQQQIKDSQLVIIDGVGKCTSIRIAFGLSSLRLRYSGNKKAPDDEYSLKQLVLDLKTIANLGENILLKWA